MSLWSKIRGTVETIFQIGLGGPQIKASSGAVEARNAGDSAYAVVRGATPAGNNDLTTKAYVDTLASRAICSAQHDGNNALPSNTGAARFLVVTTSGAVATIGQVIWDDGSGSGTSQLLSAVDGRLIVCTQAFSGGTVSLSAESLYTWDAGGTAWVNAAGNATSGNARELRLAITNAASQSSASQIPANAVILSAKLAIVTPYSGGATITLGRTGSASLLMGTTDSLATVAGTYEVPQETAWGGSALALLVTVAGSPAAGAGFAIIQYSVPDV